MLPDKKIIAFDVDGTLTASKTLITESMANLIKELVKQLFTLSYYNFNDIEQLKRRSCSFSFAVRSLVCFIYSTYNYIII